MGRWPGVEGWRVIRRRRKESGRERRKESCQERKGGDELGEEGWSLVRNGRRGRFKSGQERKN
jgi:hypothetical protein